MSDKCGTCAFFRPDSANTFFGWCGNNKRRIEPNSAFPSGTMPSVSREHSCGHYSEPWASLTPPALKQKPAESGGSDMRCSQCGMKECCGADAGVGLSKLIKLERRVIYTGKDSSGFEVIRVHPDLMYIIQDAFGAHYQDPPALKQKPAEEGEDE